MATNNSKQRFLLPLTLIVLASALLTGCRGTPAPDPSMTSVRSGSSGTGAQSDDWIRAQELGRAGDLGLEGRNREMMGDENRIEGMFPSIFFEFDQSFIRPEDRATIQTVADYLTSNSGVSLLIEGHCDWRGTTEYNLALGGRRAQSVRNYLEQLGINPTRIETLSKGDLEATTEGTETQMQQDRRADFILFR